VSHGLCVNEIWARRGDLVAYRLVCCFSCSDKPAVINVHSGDKADDEDEDTEAENEDEDEEDGEDGEEVGEKTEAGDFRPPVSNVKRKVKPIPPESSMFIFKSTNR